MRLELGEIFIKDVQFGAETCVKDGVLYVNKDELIKVAGDDEHIASIEVFLARPGESVRIIPVKDVIEPRVKVEGKGGVFPCRGIEPLLAAVGTEGRSIERDERCPAGLGPIYPFDRGMELGYRADIAGHEAGHLRPV